MYYWYFRRLYNFALSSATVISTLYWYKELLTILNIMLSSTDTRVYWFAFLQCNFALNWNVSCSMWIRYKETFTLRILTRKILAAPSRPTWELIRKRNARNADPDTRCYALDERMIDSGGTIQWEQNRICRILNRKMQNLNMTFTLYNLNCNLKCKKGKRKTVSGKRVQRSGVCMHLQV